MNSETARNSAQELMANNLSAIMNAMKEFTVVGQAQSTTFTYWDDFMKGARVLLHMLRAEKDGMFDLHLNAVCESLPWFHIASRHN